MFRTREEQLFVCGLNNGDWRRKTGKCSKILLPFEALLIRPQEAASPELPVNSLPSTSTTTAHSSIFFRYHLFFNSSLPLTVSGVISRVFSQ